MRLNRFGKWSISSLNGIIMVGFGTIAILFPSITIAALAIYFAIAIFIGGLILGISSIRFRNSIPNWKSKLFEGFISLVLGLVIIFYPNSAAAFLVIVIGLWASFIGIVFIISYFLNKTPSIVSSLNLISGIISLALGVAIIVNPFGSTRFIIILIGVYSIAYGVFTMAYTSIRSNEIENKE